MTAFSERPTKILASLHRLRQENEKLRKVNKDLAKKCDLMLDHIEAAEADLTNLRLALTVLQSIVDLNPNLDAKNEDVSS